MRRPLGTCSDSDPALHLAAASRDIEGAKKVLYTNIPGIIEAGMKGFDPEEYQLGQANTKEGQPCRFFFQSSTILTVIQQQFYVRSTVNPDTVVRCQLIQGGNITSGVQLILTQLCAANSSREGCMSHTIRFVMKIQLTSRNELLPRYLQRRLQALQSSACVVEDLPGVT